MTCKEVVELVTDYLEGKLPADLHAQIDEHLSGCTGCTNYFEQMRQTIQITGQLREEDLSQDQLDDLLNIFRGWKKD